MKIKPLAQKDVPIVHALGAPQDEFILRPDTRGFWTEKQLARWFASESDVCLGAWEGDELVGFALATLHVPTGKAIIENLFVVPNERRRSIGLELVKRLIEELIAKGACYVKSMLRGENIASRALHCKLNFATCGQFYWMGLRIA